MSPPGAPSIRATEKAAYAARQAIATARERRRRAWVLGSGVIARVRCWSRPWRRTGAYDICLRRRLGRRSRRLTRPRGRGCPLRGVAAFSAAGPPRHEPRHQHERDRDEHREQHQSRDRVGTELLVDGRRVAGPDDPELGLVVDAEHARREYG